MIFHVVRKVSSTSIPLSVQPAPLSTSRPCTTWQSLALHQMRRLLFDWQPADKRQVGRPRLFAVPLQHKYTDQNLSFDGLKGVDRWIVHLFRCVDFLDTFLAMLKRRTETRRQTNGGRSSHASIGDPSPCYRASCWTAADDKLGCFDHLTVYVAEELVSRPDDGPPADVETYDDQTVLIFWPKKSSMRLGYRHNVKPIVDELHNQVKTKQLSDAQVVAWLQLVIDCWCLEGWFHEVRLDPDFLRRLCLDLNERALGAHLLDVLVQFRP